MSSRSAVSTVTFAVLLVASSFSVAIWSEESSAHIDEINGRYYYNQLDKVQQLIYDAFDKLDLKDVFTTNGEEYCVGVSVKLPDSYLLKGEEKYVKDIVFNDIARAWQATYLDNPYSWWTWSTSDAKQAISMVVDSSQLEPPCIMSVSKTLRFNVKVSKDFAANSPYDNYENLAERVKAVEDAVHEITENGSVKKDSGSIADRVESINSFLTSRSYKYDAEKTSPFSASVYGAFVYATDGVHKIVCTGFSQAFRALCMETGVPCTSVIGVVASTGNEGHMWNVVKNGNPVYGVDVTQNLSANDRKECLMVGYNDKMNNVAFGQSHQPFIPSNDAIEKGCYAFTDFRAPVLAANGYKWSQNSLLNTVISCAPWVVVTAICTLLAYALLLSAGKKGE